MKPLRGLVTEEKMHEHARVMCQSILKAYKHLSKRLTRARIDVFRLYDWNSPEIRIVVDWYAGHLVVAEYERAQTSPAYLPHMAHAAAAALGVPQAQTHIKRRHTNVKDGLRYTKIDSRGKRIEVHEGPLQFLVNLTDFLDTGLFSDHRNTRAMITKMAQGGSFLNVFAYTGTATCAAAAGGAQNTVTVDRSATYIEWAKDNIRLNGLWGNHHTFVQADALQYLEKARHHGQQFDLAFIDPPSFFKIEKAQVAFDINRDHPSLLRSVLMLMRPHGRVLFSTNHQRFSPNFTGLAIKRVTPLTPRTIPEDYRNKTVHSCWLIEV